MLGKLQDNISDSITNKTVIILAVCQKEGYGEGGGEIYYSF